MDANIDPSTYVVPESNDPPRTKEYEEAEGREKTKWRSMMADWNKVTDKTLERRVRRGLPDDMRGEIWVSYLNNGLQDKLEAEIQRKIPEGFYENIDELKKELTTIAMIVDMNAGNLVTPTLNLTPRGRDLARSCKIPVATVSQILVDLPRSDIPLKKDTPEDIENFNKWLDIALWYAAISPEYGDHIKPGYVQTFGRLLTPLIIHFNDIDSKQLQYLFYYVFTTRGYRDLIDPSYYYSFVDMFINIAERHIGDLWERIFKVMGGSDKSSVSNTKQIKTSEVSGMILSAIDLMTLYVTPDNYSFNIHLYHLYIYTKETPIILLSRIAMSVLNTLRHNIMGCKGPDYDPVYCFTLFLQKQRYLYKMVNAHKIIHDAFIFNISKKEKRIYIDMYTKNMKLVKAKEQATASEHAAAAAEVEEERAKEDDATREAEEADADDASTDSSNASTIVLG